MSGQPGLGIAECTLAAPRVRVRVEGRPGPLLTVGTRANKDATIACLNVLTLRSCTAYQNRDAISLVTGGFVFGMQPIVAGLVATLVQIFLMLRASKVCLFLSTERNPSLARDGHRDWAASDCRTSLPDPHYVSAAFPVQKT